MPSLPRFRFSRTAAIPWLLAPALTAWLAILSGGVARAELSEAAFGDPPAAARPSALWTWLNRRVEPPRITGELEEMKAKGMRGAIICNNRIVGDLRMGLDKGFTRTNLSGEFTAKFFGYFVDKGAIPYGEHEPWPYHDNNGNAALLVRLGTNGIAARTFCKVPILPAKPQC